MKLRLPFFDVLRAKARARLSPIASRLPYRRFREKKFFLPALGVFLLVFYSMFFTTRARTVATTGAQSGDFRVSITVSGEIRAANSMTLTSPTVWYGGEPQVVWLIPEGTTVKKGDMVAQLDTANIAKFLNDQRSQLTISLSDRAKMEADQKATTDGIDAALKNAEFQYELSKLSMERVKFEAEVQRRERQVQLMRDSIAVEQARSRIETQKIINKSELYKIDVQIMKARSDVEKALRDLDKFSIRAPMPGLVVYEMNWRSGRKVSVSDQLWGGSSIISLPDLSKMQTIGEVNEVDVSKVKKGLKATVKLDAFPERSFDGTVASVGTIGQQNDRTTGIKTFEVDVDIDQTDPVLKPGMTTSIEILVETVPGSVFVPLEAVFSKEGKMVVYIASGSGYREAEVQTGQRNSNYVVITKGLTGKERVALRDPTLKEDETQTETTKETKL